MKCYCVETSDKFTYFIENVEPEYMENVEHAYWKKELKLITTFFPQHPVLFLKWICVSTV